MHLFVDCKLVDSVWTEIFQKINEFNEQNESNMDTLDIKNICHFCIDIISRFTFGKRKYE
jgi:hypothetical protein